MAAGELKFHRAVWRLEGVAFFEISLAKEVQLYQAALRSLWTSASGAKVIPSRACTPCRIFRPAAQFEIRCRHGDCIVLNDEVLMVLVI